MRQTTTLTTLSWASTALASSPWGYGKTKGTHQGKGKGKPGCLPMVNSEGLRELVNIDDLMGHCSQFQNFADANRHTGNTSHNATVDYIYNSLKSMDNYWDVELQPFNATLQIYGNATLSVFSIDDETPAPVDINVMENSPSGDFEGTSLVLVPNVGCEDSDFDPIALDGKIALISRGNCTFSSKSARAGVAGAVAALVYNNIEGDLQGTLGGDDEIGPHVPTAGMSDEAGTALIALLKEGDVAADYWVSTLIETVFTNNVIATSKVGDPDNTLFLGSHSDSVFAGPGINDNGSGSSSLLTIAKALSNFATKSRVRLAWWSAEEHGLLGSAYYVDNASNATLDQIRVYLNFDMIASPNFVLGIYDGSGREFNLTGPPGSGDAQELFESFFTSQGWGTVASQFTGRSDYGPFLDVGVPCGGLFTGAEQVKSEEEASMFGGEVDVAFDVNYHKVGDDYTNLNPTAFEINGQAIAHAVGTYAASFEGFPVRVTEGVEKVRRRRSFAVHEKKRGQREEGHVHAVKRAKGEKGISMSCGGHGGDDM